MAIARALAPSPALLIADEPTGNLDTDTGRQIADLLFAQQAERGTTLLLVTHDPALAARCSRQIHVRSGEIEADSAPRGPSGGDGMTAAGSRIALAFRLALRELRGGLGGFYIFLACIALGTGAIAAVNSVSRSITDAISTQGQSLLAGDVRFELNNREATPDELTYLNSLGQLSQSTGLRSMARLPDGSDQALVEVKAVDGAYPLYGTFEANPDQPLSTLLAVKDGTYGAVVAPAAGAAEPQNRQRAAARQHQAAGSPAR